MELSLADQTAAETQAAIDKLITDREQGPQALSAPLYIEYHPRDGGPTKMLKIIDTKQDPLEPARHKVISAPEVTSEVSFPITRTQHELTAQDRADWKVPRVVSAWKNPGLQRIDLQTRIANDPNLNRAVPNVGTKVGSFVDALDEAEAEVRKEREAAALEKAAGGKTQLREAYLAKVAKRARKEGPREKAPGTEAQSTQEEYDSRLFAKARPATTGPYDGPLFAAQAVRELYVPKSGQVEFEKDETQ